MSDSRPSPADALRQQLNDWLQPILNQLELAEQERQWPQVEQLCKQALQRDGENWSLWQRLAQSYEERSDWAQAETLWRHLTQRFNSRPEPYLALAALQRRRGAPDAARVVLEEAERRVGDSDLLRRSLAVIDDPWALGEAIPQLAPGASAGELARALQLAQQHLESGRFAEAEAVLEQILVLKPHAGRVHLSLAQLRWRRGDLDALIAQLQPVLGDPAAAATLQERQPLTLLLGRALLAREQWQQADALLAALAPDPQQGGPLEVMLARAECAMALGDDLAARPWLERCLQQQPGLARAEVLLGELSLRLGDWSAAIAALTRAVALQPGDPQAAALLEQARRDQLWWRGEAALKQADWEQAAEAYRLLLDLDPDHRQALARLDLLASLNPASLVPSEERLDDAATRQEQFRLRLDRFEAQLKMLGVLP